MRKIRKVRLQKEFTQDFMASKLHLTPTAYGRLERGETSIKVDQLLAISRILNVEPKYFLDCDNTIVINNPIQNKTASENLGGEIITNVNEELLKNIISLIQQTNDLTRKLIEKI